MPTTDTLIDDIYGVLASNDFLLELQEVVRKPREGNGTLRMSNAGKPCNRQLWYEVNDKEGGEELLPHTFLKFIYGDILEDVVLKLAEMAGHTVTHQQHEVELNGITGHMDGVVDGMLIDVKTASKFSFKKFEEGLTPEGDGFGYLDQLGLYLSCLQEDDSVTVKDKAAFLAINKETGKLHLDVHTFDERKFRELHERLARTIVDVGGEQPPERAFEPEPDGKGGNYRLGVQCSYCPFKFKCYPEARTFLYSSGPRYLTRVGKAPKVPEVDRDGVIIGGQNF